MRPFRTRLPFAPLLLAAILAGCGSQSDAETASDAQATAEAPAPGPTPASLYPAPEPTMPDDGNVVEVVAEDYAFDAPEEVLSGWTTFRLRNTGEETHFLYVTRLPEGRTYDEYVADVVGAVNDIWYRMRDEGLDKAAAFEELGTAIPAWFWTGAVPYGGPGLVVPQGVSQFTVELEPGNYVLECFMKTAEGEFHHAEGMVRALTVLEERSDASPPEAQVHLTLTADGIQAEGEPSVGTNTVELTFADQPDVGFGNDVHVVHLGEELAPGALAPWMDAFTLDGLMNPAPAPFVGGSHERPEGNRVFFSVELIPGRYAWISESPEETGGIFREFVVR